MVKTLTDKMKEEIVEAQINFLQENHPFYLQSNGGFLKQYLAEGLKGYSPERASANRKVDMKLLESLQDGNNTTAGKLIMAARIYNFDVYDYGESLKDKHLMKLYRKDETARKRVRNYGEKTSKLLVDYLTKKGLID